MASRLRVAIYFAVAFVLSGNPATALDIVGTYDHEPPIAAVLEVRREADRYLVKLKGGVPSNLGVASPADCLIEARGELKGDLLEVQLNPKQSDVVSDDTIEADTILISAKIRFKQGGADVTWIDLQGNCPTLSQFSGHYRKTPLP